MQDIIQSLNRAIAKQGWLGGDKLHRIGNPFGWVDGDRTYFDNLPDSLSILPFISMFYEQYPTPDTILTSDYEQVKNACEEQLRQFGKHFFPIVPANYDLANNIASTTLARTQDYCFIKTYCDALGDSPKQLDIGPGLGSHALYNPSLGTNSEFYALEASPRSYAVQRHFFRYLSPYPGGYLDLIECENFDLSEERIVDELTSSSYKIKHCPSWYFPLISNESLDLITATWVLNEVNFSGILWLIAHGTRVLRQDGYFYIRDSGKLKPNRHSISYDELLVKLGFVEVARLNIRNRVDYYGTPRVYQKKAETNYSFEELVDLTLGKFAVTVHGADYAQNIETMPQ